MTEPNQPTSPPPNNPSPGDDVQSAVQTLEMAANPTESAKAAAACELLSSAFPGRVTTPETATEYKAEISRPWSQTCWTPAAGYALAIILETGSKFVIRTSGHNPNAGFSNVDETGIVLDLQRLNSRALEKGVLQAGAGNTWGEVYSYLEENKLSAIGGREQGVGLAGFLLGGGLPAVPNLYGIGAAGVRNFEIVLADCTIINTNSDSHPDLYRALKGGGSNFGIVTRFDLATHPLINIQYTINIYNPSDYINIIDATVQVQEAMETDPKIGLFTNFNNGFVAVGLLYADTPTESPRAFEPFFKLESLMQSALPKTNGTILSLAQTMGHQLAESQKRAISSVSTKVSRELYAEIFKAWQEVCKTLPSAVNLHFTIQPVSSGGVQAGEDQGGNILGLEKVPQCWWVFTAEWLGLDEEDVAIHEAVSTIAERARELARNRGLLLDFILFTFARKKQNVMRSYGEDNVRKMKEVAAKYDPNGVFQKLQNDGFLLRNV